MSAKPKHPHTGHQTCAHRTYDLSCEEYEQLWQRAQGRCEICRIGRRSTANKKLFIDHHARLGVWAARGLLCNGCNTVLMEDNLWCKEAEAYYANQWWIKTFEAQGIPLAVSEPEVGQAVSAGRAHRCIWIRSEEGWHCQYACGFHYSYRPGALSRRWRNLHYNLGPRNITVQKAS